MSDVDFHEPFVRALTRHERVIRAYIRSAGVSRTEDVDEIMQEVSLAAWDKFDQLRNVEELPRWACVIARFEILKFRRRHARDRLMLSEHVAELLMEEGLEECSLKEQLLDQLQRCLDKLPDANRHLVLAAYEPGSTIEDLAKRLGRKANAVYQQLWRLRRALGKCVNNSLQNETAETIS